MNFILTATQQLIDKFFTRRKKFDPDKFFVYWKHYIPGVNAEVTYGLRDAGTTCTIKYDGKVVAEGRSFMSDAEKQFSKREGRKHSMRRAIEVLNLPKEVRTELYNRHLKSIKSV